MQDNFGASPSSAEAGNSMNSSGDGSIVNWDKHRAAISQSSNSNTMTLIKKNRRNNITTTNNCNASNGLSEAMMRPSESVHDQATSACSNRLDRTSKTPSMKSSASPNTLTEMGKSSVTTGLGSSRGVLAKMFRVPVGPTSRGIRHESKARKRQTTIEADMTTISSSSSSSTNDTAIPSRSRGYISQDGPAREGYRRVKRSSPLEAGKSDKVVSSRDIMGANSSRGFANHSNSNNFHNSSSSSSSGSSANVPTHTTHLPPAPAPAAATTTTASSMSLTHSANHISMHSNQYNSGNNNNNNNNTSSSNRSDVMDDGNANNKERCVCAGTPGRIHSAASSLSRPNTTTNAATATIASLPSHPILPPLTVLHDTSPRRHGLPMLASITRKRVTKAKQDGDSLATSSVQRVGAARRPLSSESLPVVISPSGRNRVGGAVGSSNHNGSSNCFLGDAGDSSSSSKAESRRHHLPLRQPHHLADADVPQEIIPIGNCLLPSPGAISSLEAEKDALTSIDNSMDISKRRSSAHSTTNALLDSENDGAGVATTREGCARDDQSTGPGRMDSTSANTMEGCAAVLGDAHPSVSGNVAKPATIQRVTTTTTTIATSITSTSTSVNLPDAIRRPGSGNEPRAGCVVDPDECDVCPGNVASTISSVMNTSTLLNSRSNNSSITSSANATNNVESDDKCSPLRRFDVHPSENGFRLSRSDILSSRNSMDTTSMTDRESFLSDITMSDLSTSSLCCGRDASRNSLSIRTPFGPGGVNVPFFSSITNNNNSNTNHYRNNNSSSCVNNSNNANHCRAEDAEAVMLQDAPLCLEEDLFVYDDVAISKDEARAKHWRVAGRKFTAVAPPPLSTSATSSGFSTPRDFAFPTSPSAPFSSDAEARQRRSNSQITSFAFTDFDVCVDEIDMDFSTFYFPIMGNRNNTNYADGGNNSDINVNSCSNTRASILLNRTDTANLGSTSSEFGGRSTVSYIFSSSKASNTIQAVEAMRRQQQQQCGLTATARPLRRLTIDVMTGHASRVKCIAVAPSERDFASCSNEDASVSLINVALRDEVGIFTGHDDTVISAAFSPNGKYLATTSKDRTLLIWDVVTAKQLLKLEHAKVVICCGFSGDSKYVVSGCQDRICRMWDTRQGKSWLTYSGHEGIVTMVAFSPDGAHICSASADKTLRVWSTITAKTRFTLRGHTGIILSCSYSNDGRRIISNDDALLRVWSSEDGSCTLSLSPRDLPSLRQMRSDKSRLGWTLACSGPGAFTNYMLVACNNRFVYLLDVETGTEVTSTFCKAPVYCLTTGSRSMVACGDSSGNIYLMRLE